MNMLFLVTSFVFLASSVQAGPSVSGGLPPHPMTMTMSIEKPRAGVDFPTESRTRIKAVLVLYNKRIAIYNEVPQLVKAEAGIDFPAENHAPIWNRYQEVLQFKNGVRVPVLLAVQNDTLVWLLNSLDPLDVLQIDSIRKAVAGVDFPTDGPVYDYYVMVLSDGTRIEMK
ncbi:hypothetical protein [Bdellovibrio sp. HCB-110]|uniref:hypothetical protein n=1 Tax=Bdellovibrio sp. HCB-110 TaxID=3391182 RepID=UPI0039B47C52